VREHVLHSVPYTRAIHSLANALRCPHEEEAVLAERRNLTESEYLSRLFQDANIGVMLLDDGFPPPDQSLTREQVEAATGIRTGGITRIETVVEDQLRMAKPFHEAVGRFDEVTASLAESGAVALKSIAAYRSGLRLAHVSWDTAEEAWNGRLDKVATGGPVRIDTKSIVDFFAIRALEHASDQQAPFQIHAGLGDPDLDLLEANPLHLRWVFENQRFRGAKIVILHGAYPYAREAAYLASVYPNAFLDISTALPPLGMREIESTIREAIAVAPLSKLMFSSDAARIPEHHALAASVARRSLGLVLKQSRDRGEIDASEEWQFAEQILWKTAHSVYGDVVAVLGETILGEAVRQPTDKTRRE